MGRIFVATAVLALISHSPAVGEELRVFTVDLDGNPKNGILVRLKEAGVSATSKNGVARFQTQLDPETGELIKVQGDGGLLRTLNAPFRTTATLEVNLKDGTSRSLLKRKELIGRVKGIRWSDSLDFELGFVVPMWNKGEVSKQADVIVRSEGRLRQVSRFHNVQFGQEPSVYSPRRVTIAVRFDENAPGGAFVVAKAAGDGETWIEELAPTLPSVNMPELAAGLYDSAAIGAELPAYFSDDIARLRDEVEAINRNTQQCLRVPNAPPQAPPLNPPPPGPQDQFPPVYPPGPPTPGPPTPVIPTPQPVQAGKVLISNRAQVEFDLQLNNHQLHVRGGGVTTVPVALGAVTTQIPGRPDSTQVWNNWEVAGNEHILRIYVCVNVEKRRQWNGGEVTPNVAARNTFLPALQPQGNYTWVTSYTAQLSSSECPPPANIVTPPTSIRPNTSYGSGYRGWPGYQQPTNSYNGGGTGTSSNGGGLLQELGKIFSGYAAGTGQYDDDYDLH